MYGGGRLFGISSDDSDGVGDDGGSMSGGEIWENRAELVLVLLSNLYSLSDSILISANRPSSCSI